MDIYREAVEVGFVAVAEGFSPTVPPDCCLAHKWAGYVYEGHLRGLNQPA